MQRRLRLGMVGGGQGAFIGAVHRIAARIDDQYELVAGALSSDPDRARDSGAALHLAPERCYSDYRAMAQAEAARADGLHPGEDLHDGVTFERFLAAVSDHRRASILYDPSHFVLQQLDYLAFIDIYHARIKAFHVKDAEFRPNGRQGVYGGYGDWQDRAGRFRSLGDGQIDFKAIFSKLAQYDFPGWAVLEWECCLKHPEDGAAEGARFIREHIIHVAEHAFDDFAGSAVDQHQINHLLGLK